MAQYLSVDATALRIGYAFISIAFLAGIGGVILYLVAWMVMPENYQPVGPVGPPVNGVPGAQAPPGTGTWARPWHDWDRAARSWAIVFGALALALLWTFGLGKGFHWPAWIIWVGFFMLFGRRRGHFCFWRGSRGAYRDRGPYGPGSPYGPNPYYSPNPPYAPGTPYVPGTADPPVAPYIPGEPGAGAAGITSPYQWGAWGTSGAASGSSTGQPSTGQPSPGPATGEPFAGGETPGPVVGGEPHEMDDRAKAEREAAAWAEAQLAAAGVPKAAPDLGQGNRRRRHIAAFVAAGASALFLLVVCAGIGLSLMSGASFGGGVGRTIDAPVSLAQVQSNYSLSVGDLQVDLSAVKFPKAHTKTVHFNVGAGNLVLAVPPATAVEVNAGVGVGHVDIFGHAGSGLQVSQGTSTGQMPQLVIDAHVGVGNIEVRQGALGNFGPIPTLPSPPTMP